MQIKVIRYARLHSFGPFCNERFEVEAEVEGFENVDTCAADLRRYVERWLQESEKQRQEEQERRLQDMAAKEQAAMGASAAAHDFGGGEPMDLDPKDEEE